MAALECQGVNLRSQVLFWKHSGPQDVSRIGPLEALVEPKTRRRGALPLRRCALEPTWARFGAENVLRTNLISIWDGLGVGFRRFLGDARRIVDATVRNFDAVLP